MGKTNVLWGNGLNLPRQGLRFSFAAPSRQTKKPILRALGVSAVNTYLVLRTRFELEFILPKGRHRRGFLEIAPRHIVKE